MVIEVEIEFEQARVVSEQLNKVSDELRETIEQIEDRFAKSGLGVSASVPMSPNQNLWFKKEGSEWKFFVERLPEGSFSPLLHASKLTRVEATRLFGDLLQAMLVEAWRQIEISKKALSRADEFLKGWKDK
jgi:hypothetical protein